MGGDPRGGGAGERVPPGICLGDAPPEVLNAIFSCCIKWMFQPHADDVINQKYNISARQKGHPHQWRI